MATSATRASVALGLLAAPALRWIAPSLVADALEPPAWAYASAVASTVIAGLAAAAGPAWRAVRIDPRTALVGD